MAELVDSRGVNLRSVPLIQNAALWRYWVPAALVLLLSVSLIALKVLRIDQMQGDTAVFLQTTESVAHHGTPMSPIFANLRAFIHRGILTVTAPKLASLPLPLSSGENANLLRFHTYFVFYPLGLFATVFPARIVLFSAYVLSFTGMLLLAYALLVRRGVGIAAALLFALLVVTHPAWGDSLLLGQFYPDRIFLLTGFALMLLASRATVNRTLLVVAAVGCAMVNERGALVAGVALVLYSLVYWKTVTDRLFKIALGAGLFVFGEVMLNVVLINEEYGQYLPVDVPHFMARLHDPHFANGLAVFLLINLALLAIAAFEWRAALVAAVVMIPNMVGSIGGAEKTGWITHYHSFYFPVLVWAAALGYARAYQLAKERKLAPYFYAAAAAIAVYVGMVDPYSEPPRFTPQHVSSTFVPSAIAQMRAYFTPDGIAFSHLGDIYAKTVPEGASVSAPESVWPFLYRNRTVEYIPMGIDQTQYVVLALVGHAGTHPLYGGVPNYLGPTVQAQVNAVVVARLRRLGYDLDHPTEIPGLGTAIVKRTRRP